MSVEGQEGTSWSPSLLQGPSEQELEQRPGAKVGGLGCSPDLPQPCSVILGRSWLLSGPWVSSYTMTGERMLPRALPGIKHANFLEKFLLPQLACILHRCFKVREQL